MTHKEFLYDLLDYYSKNPRSINSEGSCLYRQVDNNGNVQKCAIGRHIPNDLYTPDIEGISVWSLIDSRKFLSKDIVALGENFLSDMQQLHDRSEYWEGQKLSAEGLDFVEAIIDEYNLKDLDLKP